MNIGLTLVGQSITFLIFVWFVTKFVWPLIIRAMRERQKTIAEGLENAEKALRDLDQAQERAAETLREAQTQAQEIVARARSQAKSMIADARNEAQYESDRIKEAAQADIGQEMHRAREVLRGEVATLAMTGAERILESSVDRRKHSAMLDRLAAEL